MNTDTSTIIADALADAIEKQPAWRRFLPTIVTAAGVAATLLTWIIGNYALDGTAAVVLGSVVAVLSVIAQRGTPNGLTPRSNVLAQAAVRDAVDTALRDTVDAARTVAVSSSSQWRR